jgi:hypothetical protein
MTFPFLRQRKTASPVIDVPGLQRFQQRPGSLAAESVTQVALTGFYNYHLGDVITHGASHWAMDPSHDTQLFTVWGHGVMRNPFAFAPTSPQTIYAHNAAPIDAIRGVIFSGIRPERLAAAGEING